MTVIGSGTKLNNLQENIIRQCKNITLLPSICSIYQCQQKKKKEKKEERKNKKKKRKKND